MANHVSIARPYALAAFEYAREHQQLSAWQVFLTAATAISRDPTMKRLLESPEISNTQTFDLFAEILASQINVEQKNFLHLLALNKRLNVLSDITDLFNAYFAALEKISQVRVITAIQAEEAFKQKLAAALAKRMQHEVTLKCEVNPAILGGAIIHIGDKVIDGSIRGKLTRLLEFSLR